MTFCLKILETSKTIYATGNTNFYKQYEHKILGDYFHLVSISKNSILTILKTTEVSKRAGTLIYLPFS